MSAAPRKVLLLALVVCHAYVGAGAGERVVYFGQQHNGGACGHDRGHPHAPGLLGFLPVFVPVGIERGADRPHDHGCGHAHLRGQDATPPAGARTAPTPAATECPPFFAAGTAAPEAPDERLFAQSASHARPRRPDDPPGAVVRLLL